jgi:hypothetical protein
MSLAKAIAALRAVASRAATRSLCRAASQSAREAQLEPTAWPLGLGGCGCMGRSSAARRGAGADGGVQRGTRIVRARCWLRATGL